MTAAPGPVFRLATIDLRPRTAGRRCGAMMKRMWVYGGALIPERSEIAGVRAIAAADPQFSLDDFVSFARTVHDNVHRATASRDLTPVTGVMADELATWLATRLDEPEWSSPVDEHAHTAVIDASHGDHDTIVVRFGVSIGGRRRVTDWSFTRPAAEYPHLRGIVPTECTSCGAPNDLDDAGNCRYCGTHLVGVAGRWSVVAIEPPRVLDPVAPTASLEHLDPHFPVDDFLDFTRTVYWNVHQATASGNHAAMRDILTEDMRTYLTSSPDELYWDLPITELRGLDVVDAQHGALDRVTVRIRSWSPDVGDRETDIVEDWTFERPAPAPGHPAAQATACPFCGAPVDLDEDGNCRYCRTHLHGVAGRWRLAAARYPEQPMVSHPVFVKAMQSRGGRIAVLLLVLTSFVVFTAAIIAFVIALR